VKPQNGICANKLSLLPTPTLLIRKGCRTHERKAMISLKNWTFTLGGGNSHLVTHGIIPPPKQISFLTVQDLLTAICKGANLPTGQIDARLRAGAQTMGWPRNYTRIGQAPHFKRYRGKNYDSYKEAALACAAGTATPRQTLLAAGLSSEIAASKVIVPSGQVVVHGRSDQLPTNGTNYDAFLSTTLSPFVAHLSAIRRSKQLGGCPTIYVFRLVRDLPAMWGQVGLSAEWELLFNAGLHVQATSSLKSGGFEIVEADLG
jgi:hypothetical protein